MEFPNCIQKPIETITRSDKWSVRDRSYWTITIRDRMINLHVPLEMLIAFVRLHYSFIKRHRDNMSFFTIFFASRMRMLIMFRMLPAVNFAAFMENREHGEIAPQTLRILLHSSVIINKLVNHFPNGSEAICENEKKNYLLTLKTGGKNCEL